MKKLTILLIFILKLSSAQAQEWVKKRCDTTEWVHIDTLKKYSDSSGWVYDVWKEIPGSIPDSAHRYFRLEKQFRIGKTSGYLMERIRTTEYVFIPKDKTFFEIVIDSVSKP